MYYGQKNYNELQGIAPQKYRINQIGCFLVSFCNLMEAFGKGVDPLALNKSFRDKSVYRDVDDGVRDDLAWASITKHNKNIVVTNTGVGKPPSNNAIVKFTGVKNGFGTHFCKVADRDKGLIIDSWDGKTKNWSIYGGPKTWATYDDTTPKPKPAPKPAPVKPAEPAPKPKIENVTVQPGWGITHVLRAVGYSKEQYENPAEWDRLSKLNGSSDRIKLKPGQVVKVYKTPLAKRTASTPVPTVIATATTAPVEPKFEAPKPVIAPAETVVDENVVPVTVIHDAWKATYTESDMLYIAKENAVVKDVTGLHMDRQIVKGQKVNGAGVFEKEGIKYVRTHKSIEENQWYGVPLGILSDGQNPDSYVGPLLTDEDDDDGLFELDMVLEAKEMFNNLSGREKIVAFVARIQGFLLKLLETIKLRKKKEEK